MFRIIDKDVYGKDVMYTFDVLDKCYEVIGKMIIMIGHGRHDAGLIFNRDKITPTGAYEYIETLRELLDRDLIQIDEEHDRIILSEIVYEDPKYLF